MSWQDWLGLRQKYSVGSQTGIERWVVLDVETSGLDTSSAQLLAIACNAVTIDWSSRQMTLAPGDSFEVTVKPTTLVTEKANILVHNIGQQSQAEGVAISEALQMFMAYASSAPLLAFHAAFDERIMSTCVKREFNIQLPNEWLDIAMLCKATHPTVQAESLDEWLAYFGIVCAKRHQASADAWSESEVLQRIWPSLSRQCSSWRDVKRVALQQRWMR
jgi:DNA polymerase III subunit epsilon